MGGNACLFIVIDHVCLLLVDQGFLGLSWLLIWGAQALRWSLKPTFSFIFSIFFTELRLWWRSSSRRWKTGSPDLPICFSSCFSASFSLLSALMLSAWYMWYVFITWEKWPRLLGDVCLQHSQWTGLLWGVHVKNTTFQLARGKSDGSKTGEFWLCFCINQTNMQIHLMGGGAQGTGSDEKRFTEAYAHFQHVQSSLTRKSVLPNLLWAMNWRHKPSIHG